MSLLYLREREKETVAHQIHTLLDIFQKKVLKDADII